MDDLLVWASDFLFYMYRDLLNVRREIFSRYNPCEGSPIVVVVRFD